MAPSYSANLQEFINNYNKFNNLISDYKTQLDEFNEQVNTLLQHAASSGSTTAIYTSGNNKKYLKTKNGLLIAMNFDAGDDDFSYNKLNVAGGSSKYFYVNPSTMTASDISFNIEGTDEFKDGNIIQGGLVDLSFSDNELITSISGEYTTNNSGYITSNVDAGNDCAMNDLYMCDSYAKMNNKKFYGLNKDDTNNCACYIFDSQPTNQVFNILTSDHATNSDGTNISYLGIMFDNTLCTLKDKNFSNNFNNMYDNNKSGFVNEIDATYQISNCNKFTGSGPYNIRINNFDVGGTCDLKHSST